MDAAGTPGQCNVFCYPYFLTALVFLGDTLIELWIEHSGFGSLLSGGKMPPFLCWAQEVDATPPPATVCAFVPFQLCWTGLPRLLRASPWPSPQSGSRTRGLTQMDHQLQLQSFAMAEGWSRWRGRTALFDTCFSRRALLCGHPLHDSSASDWQSPPTPVC